MGKKSNSKKGGPASATLDSSPDPQLSNVQPKSTYERLLPQQLEEFCFNIDDANSLVNEYVHLAVENKTKQRMYEYLEETFSVGEPKKVRSSATICVAENQQAITTLQPHRWMQMTPRLETSTGKTRKN